MTKYKTLLVNLGFVGLLLIYFVYVWSSPAKQVLKPEAYLEACKDYRIEKLKEWKSEGIVLEIECYDAPDGWVRAYNPITGKVHREISWKEWTVRVCSNYYEKSVIDIS